MRLLALPALLLLGAAPSAPPAHPTDEECGRLWDDTVDASAPDLSPTDDMRKSFLLKEKVQLTARCLKASKASLDCPAQGARSCREQLHAPPDGGNAPGLARCVYPAVQECVQRDRLDQARADGTLDRLLAKLKSGELKPEKGTLKLTGEFATLSLGSVALASTTEVVLLTFNERNTVLRGRLVSQEPRWGGQGAAGPKSVTTGGVVLEVGRIIDERTAEVATPAK